MICVSVSFAFIVALFSVLLFSLEKVYIRYVIISITLLWYVYNSLFSHIVPIESLL